MRPSLSRWAAACWAHDEPVATKLLAELIKLEFGEMELASQEARFAVKH
jgi:hypothetical protein